MKSSPITGRKVKRKYRSHCKERQVGRHLFTKYHQACWRKNKCREGGEKLKSITPRGGNERHLLLRMKTCRLAHAKCWHAEPFTQCFTVMVVCMFSCIVLIVIIVLTLSLSVKRVDVWLKVLKHLFMVAERGYDSRVQWRRKKTSRSCSRRWKR